MRLGGGSRLRGGRSRWVGACLRVYALLFTDLLIVSRKIE